MSVYLTLYHSALKCPTNIPVEIRCFENNTLTIVNNNVLETSSISWKIRSILLTLFWDVQLLLMV